MITSNGLEGLGFKFVIDFSLQDDGDGVYISKWNPNQPVPSIAEIEQGEQVYIAEAQAKQEAKAAIKTSVINKIATNLTSEEKLWLEENL